MTFHRFEWDAFRIFTGTSPPPRPFLRNQENKIVGSMPEYGRFAREGKEIGRGGKTVTAPERPRQQRKGGERSPVHYHRRSSTRGSTASTSTTEKVSAGSGSASSPGSRSHPPEEGSVRVVVRVRPLTTEEEARCSNRIMRCCNPKSLELVTGFPIATASPGEGGIDGDSGLGLGIEGKRACSFDFDLCAHEGFSQEEMFQSCGLIPLLSAAVDGYAGTVFAYGATGSGKTYTMSGMDQVLRGSAGSNNHLRGRTRKMSGYSGSDSSSTDGLIPRSMRYLFRRIASLGPEETMGVRASFYEIYNEFVYDLLTQDDRRALQVRYDVKRGFFVQGLLEVEIRDLSDILAVVDEGNGNRRVSSHLLNKDSSRSHSLLSVCLHRELKDPEDGHPIRTFGKVTFVDLAGSERLKKSKAPNEKETASINKSLMTLGKVISALSRKHSAAAAAAAAATSTPTADILSLTQADDDDKNGSGVGKADQPPDIWVPYRDSTLTKLLMDSLGGNGLTLMLACVSPSSRHAEESASTINYAARARNIRNRPLVRIDARERVLNGLRREVNLLREENELLRREKLAPLAHDAAALEMAITRPDSGNDGLETSSPQSVVQAGGKKCITGVGATMHQQQGYSNSLEIGQASRDVAALLRKYEEECHRLRREAALAQHKALEIGKQTRQALIENEALSRTVERLQRTLGIEQTGHSSAPETPVVGKQQCRENGGGILAELEVKENGRASHQRRLLAADSTMARATKEGSEGCASVEVLHLRRVNEALVERLEAVERSNSKMAAAKTGGRGGKKHLNAEPRGQRVSGRGGARSAVDAFEKRTPRGKMSSIKTEQLIPQGGNESGPSSTSDFIYPTRGTRTTRQPTQRDPRGRLLLRGSKVKDDESPGREEIVSTVTVQPQPIHLVGGPGRRMIGRWGRLGGVKGVGRARRLGTPESSDGDPTWTSGASKLDPPPATDRAGSTMRGDDHPPGLDVSASSLASDERRTERTGKEAAPGAGSPSEACVRKHGDGNAARGWEDPASTPSVPEREGGDGEDFEAGKQPRSQAKQEQEGEKREEDGEEEVDTAAKTVSKQRQQLSTPGMA